MANQPPRWFRDWCSNDYWHFQVRIEWKIKLVLWLSGVILAALIGGMVFQIFWK